ITYNGEIYNHKALRAELAASGSGLHFVGHSDTEVLLAAVDAWGVHGALKRFNGMFAFALLDRNEGSLFLARDRLGEKPLYYTKRGKALLFASELKALERYPAWNGVVDLSSLVKYFRYSYVQGNQSIFQDVKKVPPGACIRFDLRDLSETVHAYWSLDDVVLSGI